MEEKREKEEHDWGGGLQTFLHKHCMGSERTGRSWSGDDISKALGIEAAQTNGWNKEEKKRKKKPKPNSTVITVMLINKT